MTASIAAKSFDEKRIDEIFARLDSCHEPGAAVGIAIGGLPVYRKGFGLASVELPVTLSPHVRMRIGSVTKQFACLAYMLLCEEGKATPADTVGMHLANLHPVARTVTVRQLMSHTSGLRDSCDIRARLSGQGGTPTSCAGLVAMYEELDDVNSQPGETWGYNNGGYLILSAVIEKLAQRPLAQFLHERVFTPLAMHDTRVRAWDADLMSNSARTHVRTSSGGFQSAHWGLEWDGAGAIVSTVSDMLRWLSHMNNPIVGSRETWQAMVEPAVLRSGSLTHYGLGLATGTFRGTPTIYHNGGWLGANAKILKAPKYDLDIVVMVNRGDVSAADLVQEVLDACAPDPEAVAKVHRPAVSGNFRSSATGRVVQLYGVEGQQFVCVDGISLPYRAGADAILRPTESWAHINRTVRIHGNPSDPRSIVLTDFGRDDELVRLGQAGESDGRAIAGRYSSAATRTEAVIHRSGDRFGLTMHGRFSSIEYQLAPLSKDIWCTSSPTSTPYRLTLSFNNEDRSVVKVSTGNNRDLPFRRVA